MLCRVDRYDLPQMPFVHDIEYLAHDRRRTHHQADKQIGCLLMRQPLRQRVGLVLRTYDRLLGEDVFARVPELADQTDPVLVDRVVERVR
jgi:hypothetical protein